MACSTFSKENAESFHFAAAFRTHDTSCKSSPLSQRKEEIRELRTCCYDKTFGLKSSSLGHDPNSDSNLTSSVILLQSLLKKKEVRSFVKDSSVVDKFIL